MTLIAILVIGQTNGDNKDDGDDDQNGEPGVSIIFKIRVFYKAWFEGFEFFIVWPYAVFHKMQVVFYKSAHFMYLWRINSVFAKCGLQYSKILK